MIGPSFSKELQAAGLLSLPFSWSIYGVEYSDRITPEQRHAIEVVVAAHDPTTPVITRQEAKTSEIQNARTVEDLKVILLTMV